jgi:hypothetical protein
MSDATRKSYLANAYRVLLTRARQGMVIFVPAGSEIDEPLDGFPSPRTVRSTLRLCSSSGPMSIFGGETDGTRD